MRFVLDIPGPYMLEFSSSTARDRFRTAKENPIPVATGLIFAGIPYAVGAGIAIFAPPPLKPIGVSMLVPGPTDPVLFALGYSVGQEFEDDIIEFVNHGIPTIPSVRDVDHLDFRHYYM